VLQLLASAVVMCAIFVVTSTRLPHRNVLFSYPEMTYDGAQLVPRNTYSAERERELEDMPKQDNGELDVDISSAPLQEQVSNMDFSVSVLRPHSKKSHAAPKQGGLTGHHAVVGGVSASWARNARTSALAEIPQASNMQKLSSAYLEDQGINTGEEFNRLLSNRVPMGQENPSVFFSAGRQVADLQPNPPATAYPKPPLNKLTHMGVYTGTEHQQWDDSMVKSKGMEEPYNFGASPAREWDSPSRRAGSWGVFTATPGSMAMLAQEAKADLVQVLAEKSDMMGGANVTVDSFPDVDSDLPEHMRINADPRAAWTNKAPSNGNLQTAGVNTGEEHHDFGDVHVKRGEVSPVHVGVQHNLAAAGVNTGDDTIIHVDKGPEVYVPDTVPTAAPRKTKQHKLDKLGVNTGDQHTQWGDSLVSHKGLEASYNLGPSPNREYTSATPFPGTASWPAKGTRADKLGQKLHTASAHEFFKKSVKPLMQPAVKRAAAPQRAAAAHLHTQLHVAQTATHVTEGKKHSAMVANLAAEPYIIEADAAKARAAEAESALARDVVRAHKAEEIAGRAHKQALKVGLAAAKVAAAKRVLSAAKNVFSENLAEARSEMPHKKMVRKQVLTRKVTRQQTKAVVDQAKLDSDMQKDSIENHAKATANDVNAFFSSVNSNSNDRTNLFVPPHLAAVEPDLAGPMSDIVSGKKSAPQQVLRARPLRSRATAAAHHAALRQGHKGIHFSRTELCAVSVWGVHPLCPDSYDVHHESFVNV